MILTALSYALITILGAVMFPLNALNLFIFLGVDIAGFITSAAVWYAEFNSVFWPLQPVTLCLLIYLPMKIVLMVLRVMLGSRIPDAS